jgi:hypothetical protein
MSKLKYGLDLDSVLADFLKGMFDWFDEPYRVVTEWDDPFIRANYPIIMNDEKFWLGLPILSHPKDIKFEVDCYITARAIPSEISMEWLYKHGFPIAPVFTVGVKDCGQHHSKTDVIKERGIDVMVDDAPKHWEEINNVGCLCLLFCQPHNQHIFTSTRITNLNQVGKWQRLDTDLTKI